MYNTSTAPLISRRSHVLGGVVDNRLAQLHVALSRDDEREFRQRLAHDEMLRHPFTRPLSAREAFQSFGALLGLLPSAAVFIRLLWQVNDLSAFYWLLTLAGLMNIVCCAVGRSAAAKLWDALERTEDYALAIRLFVPALVGALWGLMTGGVAGLLFFGIGAFFGSLIAAMVGAFGFTLYTSLQRMFSRGGMIESRYARSIALAVNGLIVAFILLVL